MVLYIYVLDPEYEVLCIMVRFTFGVLSIDGTLTRWILSGDSG